MSNTGQLVKYDEMCRAIDAAYDVDEVKDIRDKAMAMEAYFRLAKNPEPEWRACEIRLRAERKAGQLLSEMEKAKRGADKNDSGQRSQRSTSDHVPTLSDLGISKDQSSRWQKLAKVPQEQFEAALAAPAIKPSTNGIIEQANPQKPSCREFDDGRGPMDQKALWVWGRLLEFERNGILEIDSKTILSEMTDVMKDDVLRLAILVAEWLKGAYRDDR